ncbi:MAG: hypothetical protein J6X18_00445 [Bacteroidales bacterium]|nr:hypothetical protein [Bacteroidales bacterium]
MTHYTESERPIKDITPFWYVVACVELAVCVGVLVWALIDGWWWLIKLIF